MVRSIKVLGLSLVFGFGSLMVVGCKDATPTSGAKGTGSTPTAKSSPTDMMDKMKDKVGETLKDASKEVKEKGKELVEKGKEVGADAAKGAAELLAKAKETFTKPINEMLGGVDKDILKLEEQAKTAKDDAKKTLTDKVAKAKDLVDKIKMKLTELAASPGDKWEAVKMEIEKMVAELKGLLPAAEKK